MRRFASLILCLCLLSSYAMGLAQLPAAPDPQSASIVGFAQDTDQAAIPSAVLTLTWEGGAHHLTVTADDKGYFSIPGLGAAETYTVSVTAKGFSTFTQPGVMLAQGQQYELDDVRLKPATDTSVDAVSMEELAVLQIHAEEQQKILGVLPNFYVTYAGSRAAPLSTKLKYQLAFKTLESPIDVAAAAFVGALNQAADTPHYGQGWASYGQRTGAVYAGGVTDILFGGAVFPSLFHQDPRYFYQGTGTNKSRALHAILSPVLCRGDDGRTQFNVSSVSGDLVSGGLSTLYYPRQDRGVGMVFTSAATVTGGRVANALLQEFLFGRMKRHPQP